MGFMDIFIERSDDNTSAVPVPQKSAPPKIGGAPPAVNIAAPSYAPAYTSYPTPGVSADDMAKFNSHFDELFDQANLPGPDYYEFNKMCQAMNTLSDDVKLQAVFTGLQIQGLTKEKLIDSANHYIAILDEDAKKFSSAVDTKLMGEVQIKRKTVEDRKADIAKKQALIQQLQDEIIKENQEVISLSSEADEQERKATDKFNTYKAACESRKSSISNDITKINTYVR